MVSPTPSPVQSPGFNSNLVYSLLKHRLCHDPKFDVLSQSRKGIFKDLKGYYKCVQIFTGEVVVAAIEKEVLWDDTILYADCDLFAFT